MTIGLHCQRGVSLVEMMIVVAVLFVIGAISIPAYTGYVETARQEIMVTRAESFRAYATNYRIDNGTYLAGTYDPALGVNDFEEPMGFRIDNDTSGISFTVAPGACGTIADCYQLTLQDPNGNVLRWTPTEFEFIATQ